MTVSMQIDYGAATTSLRKVFAIVKSDVAALRDLLARRGGSACVPAAVWDAPAHLAQVLAGLPSFLRDAYTHLRELVPDGMPEFPVYGLRASGYALFPSPPPAPPPNPIPLTSCAPRARLPETLMIACFSCQEFVMCWSCMWRLRPISSPPLRAPVSRLVACMHARADHGSCLNTSVRS